MNLSLSIFFLSYTMTMENQVFDHEIISSDLFKTVIRNMSKALP